METMIVCMPYISLFLYLCTFLVLTGIDFVRYVCFARSEVVVSFFSLQFFVDFNVAPLVFFTWMLISYNNVDYRSRGLTF